MIYADTSIEEIVNSGNIFVEYLSKKGIRCIRCGEPVWGTLEEAAKAKGFDAAAIQSILEEMNQLNDKRDPGNKTLK